ncbi:MAG: Holliday junction resolvase RuvX [Lachnospiraceae bacterium]|nr:Holliday junction resolvase RuvX [Lachnospiraceae bacterium]
MRIMGLDFGSKTVGVAISDPLLLTAQSLETIYRQQENKLRRTLARIEALCTEYEVDLIVLGLPKNMDDTEGERCEKTRAFQEMLERRTGISVVFQDERLTTWEADQILIEDGIPFEERKKYVDKIAASLILQEYLDARRS